MKWSGRLASRTLGKAIGAQRWVWGGGNGNQLGGPMTGSGKKDGLRKERRFKGRRRRREANNEARSERGGAGAKAPGGQNPNPKPEVRVRSGLLGAALGRSGEGERTRWNAPGLAGPWRRAGFARGPGVLQRGDASTDGSSGRSIVTSPSDVVSVAAWARLPVSPGATAIAWPPSSVRVQG